MSTGGKTITPPFTFLDLGKVPTKKSLRGIQDQIIETELPPNDEHDVRSLQQATTLRIWNDCDDSVWVYVIYQQGNSLYQRSWTSIEQADALSVGAVDGSSFWIYGIDGSLTPTWTSSSSEYCFSAGNCFRKINFNSRLDTFNYLGCGTEDVSVTRPPTSPPTRPSLISTTRAPTRVPTQSVQQTRPPTGAPTRFPTRAPTQEPLNQAPPRPVINPTRLPTNFPTRPPTQAPTQAINPAPPRPGGNPGGIEQQWLDEHNRRRQDFYDRFPEYNLSPAPLKWSNSVAESAQRYANRLIGLNGCTIQHGYQNDNYGGENLAANWGGSNPRSPAAVLEAWYDDEIDLNRMELVGQKYHASQAIWRSSRYLGCAQAEKNYGSGKCFIQVCRYIAPGNCFFNGRDSYYPDNCLSRYPSERNWICSVLSEVLGQVCAGDDEKCPAEGCF